ncbi:Bug family tripartite tricarboxylate transporter substrate binding protein [Aquabacterium sp.]|uniref:Bug family tripartite tricarboxylate transporter substrate binding protein n=1 Tax=Aquabacterium sp. TaxID=1872578 RepID=UPI002D7EE254|nr:tripartite tricarboxylate transporter substrate-binding protein [Aquabacterium sp.]
MMKAEQGACPDQQIRTLAPPQSNPRSGISAQDPPRPAAAVDSDLLYQGALMNTPRRILLQTALATCCALFAGTAGAAGYPDRPIKLLVPFSPGGNADLVGRVLGARMGQTLGQTLVIENRAGAGGGIGAEAVAKSPPDGYNLLIGTNGPLTVNPVLQAKLRYDVFKDFAPVALAGVVPHALVVSLSMPAKTLPELLALARKKPVSVATAGIGSSTHLTLERLNAQAGVKLEHIPYRGGSTPVGDLIGGTLDAVIMELSAALPLHQSGKARVLAVGSMQRAPSAPDVHTFHEGGVKDFVASSYVGLLAPANTPPEVIIRLQKAAAEALSHASVLDKLVPLGFEAATAAQQTPAGFSALLKAEYERAAQIVKSAGIKLE